MSVLEVSRLRRLSGNLRFPGDKSITHRCLFLAALAEGESRFAYPATGDDCLRTVNA
ncbi:MAG TPA: 3-phosphoshikimate 1-carboxyvinyltransferase, partial [Candidatus Ozemobacteraceae bacterium]|nr:3-phosphoshikimate 1-carboxyvinyltransferase [Candidatus Ozemobacteraceae bacterium]